MCAYIYIYIYIHLSLSIYIYIYIYIYTEDGGEGEAPRRLFATGDAAAAARVKALVDELLPTYQKRMKCDDCGEIFLSNAAAQEHMEKAEHFFFSDLRPGAA